MNLLSSKMIIVQSASGDAYERMLMATKPQHDRFARNVGARRQTFFGVRRGYYDWHSTFNRIPMFYDLYSEGHRGWVLYIDADAVVIDADFGVISYLQEHEKYMIIAAPGSQLGDWDINAGILFINFSHKSCADLIERWRSDFNRFISDEDLRKSQEPWSLLHNGNPIDDQIILQTILQDKKFAGQILLEKSGLINYGNASFVRQVIRATGLSPDQRLFEIQSMIKSTERMYDNNYLISQIYLGLLERFPDPGGLNHYANLINNNKNYEIKDVIRDLATSTEGKSLFLKRI